MEFPLNTESSHGFISHEVLSHRVFSHGILSISIQVHWCEYYRLKLGLIQHNTNNGAESLHNTLKTVLISNMQNMGLSTIAHRLAIDVLWKDCEAKYNSICVDINAPRRAYTEGVEDSLSHINIMDFRVRCCFTQVVASQAHLSHHALQVKG